MGNAVITDTDWTATAMATALRVSEGLRPKCFSYRNLKMGQKSPEVEPWQFILLYKPLLYTCSNRCAGEGEGSWISVTLIRIWDQKYDIGPLAASDTVHGLDLDPKMYGIRNFPQTT